MNDKVSRKYTDASKEERPVIDRTNLFITE